MFFSEYSCDFSSIFRVFPPQKWGYFLLVFIGYVHEYGLT